MSLGTVLRELREEKGLSLREVEARTKGEVSNSYLSQLENDQIGNPSLRVLQRLADAYQVSFEFVLRRAGVLPQSQRAGAVKGWAMYGLPADMTEEEAKALRAVLEAMRRPKAPRHLKKEV